MRLLVRLHRFRGPPIQGLADILHARGEAAGGSQDRRGVSDVAFRRRDDNPLPKTVGKLKTRKRRVLVFT